MKRSRPMRRQLLRHFLMASVLPALLLSLALCAISYFQTVQRIMQKNESAMALAMQSINGKIQTVTTLIKEIPTLNGASSRLSADSFYSILLDADQALLPFHPERLEAYRRIKRQITSAYINSGNYMNGAFVLTSKGHVFSFSNTFGLLGDAVKPMEAYLDANDGLAVMPRGLEKEYQKSFRLLANPLVSALTISSPLLNSSGECIAVCLVDLNSAFFDTLVDLRTDQSDVVYVIGDDGTVWYESTPPGEAKAFNEGNRARWQGAEGVYFDWRAQRIACHQHIDQWKGATFVYDSPVGWLTLMESTIWVSLGVGIMAIGYALVAARYNADKFAAPIARLAEVMKGDAQLPRSIAPSRGIEEIEALQHHYNQMLQAIERYIQQNYENELAMSRMKMKAMEAQMDSHFLYNTLECIYSMALMERAGDVAKVTKSLSDMFHYISQHGGATVLVREEMRHVRDYLTIQQTRFGGQISYQVEVAPALLERPMLKLVLQPLVENAFKHGFSRKPGVGCIRILGVMTPGGMLFQVGDDGQGMTPERLREVIARLERGVEPGSGTGIGLLNLSQRLRLHYGDGTRMHIESWLGEGTLISIQLPEGGMEHVPVRDY